MKSYEFSYIDSNGKELVRPIVDANNLKLARIMVKSLYRLSQPTS
jgi:hypothetical protein